MTCFESVVDCGMINGMRWNLPKIDPAAREEAWRNHHSVTPAKVPTVTRTRRIEPLVSIDPVAHDKRINNLVQQFTENRELHNTKTGDSRLAFKGH